MAELIPRQVESDEDKQKAGCLIREHLEELNERVVKGINTDLERKEGPP